MGVVRWTKSAGPAQIEKLSVGGMDNNVYLLGMGDRVLGIDAGSAEADFVLERLEGRTLVGIFQTHNHGDHTQSLREVVAATAAPVYAHAADRNRIPVEVVEVGEGPLEVFDDLPLRVLHTPGHTPGSICLVLDVEGGPHLFSGDTLFPGGPGNTFNNPQAFATIMRSLDTKLFTLPDATCVYPGHGADTTIGAERPHVEEWRARGW